MLREYAGAILAALAAFSLPEGWGRCAAPKGPFSGHFSGCDADSGRGVPYDMGVIRLAEKGFEWICHG
uniref:Uncharacterized protein n=1 Tax=Klebsiella pneumoniae TaxID=573 RepID=A0A411KXF2_KLEPN|nr:hypothetical protein pB29_002 [Klebsiella pneumoniae]QBK46658.1 hypothetical protein pKPC05011 [Klebsiella pneumoniae]